MQTAALLAPPPLSGEPGPDVLTLLLLQHRRLEALLRSRVLGVPPPHRLRTLDTVLDAFAAQLGAEATAFYPVIGGLASSPGAGLDPAVTGAVTAARRGQATLGTLALPLEARLAAPSVGGDADIAPIALACEAFLEAAVTHHRRVERELFPPVLRGCTMAQREVLGARVAIVEARLRRGGALARRQLWRDARDAAT